MSAGWPFTSCAHCTALTNYRQAEARLDDNELSLAPAPSRLHDTVGKARVDSTYVSQVRNDLALTPAALTTTLTGTDSLTH